MTPRARDGWIGIAYLVFGVYCAFAYGDIAPASFFGFVGWYRLRRAAGLARPIASSQRQEASYP